MRSNESHETGEQHPSSTKKKKTANLQFLRLGGSPGGGHGNHPSVLAWKSHGHSEKPRRPQCMESQRTGHDYETFTVLGTSINILQKLNNKKILQKWRQKKAFFWYRKGKIIHHQQAHTTRNAKRSPPGRKKRPSDRIRIYTEEGKVPGVATTWVNT